MGLDRYEARALAASCGGYAEGLLEHLAASVVDSLDASRYEGCTIVHDLNRPVQRAQLPTYSAVLELGTLEHVFNFPAALKSCLERVELGGHYIAVSPVNNYVGHGFYQLSPELYFRALGEQNGFHVRCALWRSDYPLSRWRQVPDPETVAHRGRATGESARIAVHRGETSRDGGGPGRVPAAGRLRRCMAHEREESRPNRQAGYGFAATEARPSGPWPASGARAANRGRDP